MFSRFATLLPVAALIAVATAAPDALGARDSSKCSTGSNYCCNTSQTISSGTIFSGTLGGTLSGLGLLAGVTCTPVTVVGTGGGGSCTQQSVCCSNNDFNGVINVGCSPITVNA